MKYVPLFDYRELINQVRYHRSLATILVALIIGGQAWMIVSQIDTPDKEVDYYGILIYSYTCDPLEIPKRNTDQLEITRNPIKWWAACASFHWFNHNIKVIPLIFNIMVLPMVYLVAFSLTKDRLIGVVALVAFIYNPLYSDWKTSGTYDNIWSFFLLLSVWIANSRIALIPYLFSVAGKSISLMYLPAWLWTIHKTHKNKYQTIMAGGVVLSLVLIGSQYLNFVGAGIGFYPERIDQAVFRNISVLWQVIPFIALFVVLNRNFIPKIKIPNEKLVMVWIVCALLQNPVIYLFTLQDTYSYRYVPLAAFMSIFIGITLVNIGNWYQELQLRKADKVRAL